MFLDLIITQSDKRAATLYKTTKDSLPLFRKQLSFQSNLLSIPLTIHRTMASSRHFILIAVALALAIVAVSSSPYYSGYQNYAGKANISHNLIIGFRQPGDKLVYQENIVKTSKWMQIVEVQKTFNVSNYYVITQVRALDQKTNGTGATARVISGGAGYRNITLKFKSMRGHGINFVVQLYAKPRYY